MAERDGRARDTLNLYLLYSQALELDFIAFKIKIWLHPHPLRLCSDQVTLSNQSGHSNNLESISVKLSIVYQRGQKVNFLVKLSSFGFVVVAIIIL